MQHFGSLLKIKIKCRTAFSALCLSVTVMALKLLHLCRYKLSVEMWRPKSKNPFGLSVGVKVKELISDGIEVILVTSGAVGVGRQRLRHQRMMNSR